MCCLGGHVGGEGGVAGTGSVTGARLLVTVSLHVALFLRCVYNR